MNQEETNDPQFEALLDYLRFSRGFDFSGYKRTSLMRRVNKRRYLLSLSNYGDYLDYLQVHPDEFDHLFNTILINVTSFFRDEGAWELLTTKIMPRILSQKDGGEPIRIWSAGCASGEEPYSLAMVIVEQLGMEAFHGRVKIYATDMDAQALVQARQAIYSAEAIKAVPQEMLNKYFTRTADNHYQFNNDMRRRVIFGEHDLVQDAPISRLDLLVCRNTLMYFNSETQAHILARFNFALNDGGVLFLGKAEMLLTHADLFSPLDIRYRFFTKVSNPDIREHLVTIGQFPEEQFSNHASKLMSMRDLAFDTSPEAHLMIDLNGMLVGANETAKKLFSISTQDVGGLLYDMDVCYKPLALRPLVERAIAEKQPILVPDVENHTGNNETKFMDAYIIPLNDKASNLIGISIIYADISRSKSLEKKLKQSTKELESANEELQSTNEELETTNEELQSTVEELETTNEELQSTNEELETMNEELQSTNEELETINDELSLRTVELNDSKGFLETILGNLKVGIAVVDRNFHILNWNTRAEDLWGLRTNEIMGQSLLVLDIGLPVEKLKLPIRSVIEGKSEVQVVVLDTLTRRGKTVQCRVTCTPFTGGSNERQGAVLMMEVEQDGKQT